MRHGPLIALVWVVIVVLILLTFADGSGSAVPYRSQAPAMTFAPQKQAWWVRRQIEVATIIGLDASRRGRDAWPNCPDPYDHPRYTWRHTVACENRAYAERWGVWDPRAWLDSPGMFRCGLQFEPRWETRYGKLCP